MLRLIDTKRGDGTAGARLKTPHAPACGVRMKECGSHRSVAELEQETDLG